PPEYHSGRAWPVLVVLHAGKEMPRDALRRWSVEAARNGYVLAAPAWATAGRGAYEYSAAEQDAALEVVRDLRRKVSVDSDRVFLTGAGNGGSMAFDVGLSHPDQFAGILPYSGLQGHWGDRYRYNAQYLPFYVVAGDLSGGNSQENRRLFRDWIAKSFP